MDKEIEHYKGKVQEFAESDSKETIIRNVASSKVRKGIYEEVTRCNLFHASVTEEGTIFKNIIVSKVPIKTSVKIDAGAIECFAKYAALPIPVPIPEYVEYYLDQLEPYFNCRETYKFYLKALDKYRGASQYQQVINDLIVKIVNDFTSNAKLNEFKKSKHGVKTDKKYRDSISSGNHNVYHDMNKGKRFISVDVKAANFTTICDFSIEATLGFTNWNDLIASYTEDEFIRRSKYLREVVFGKIGTSKKAVMLCPFYLNRVFDIIKTFGYTSEDIDSVNGDDITFKDKGMYEDIKAKIEETYPGFYNISNYVLQKLDPKPFYIKERTDGKIELKCIPKDSVMECIKKYEGRSLDEKDLKFIYNKRIATYDRGTWETLS